MISDVPVSTGMKTPTQKGRFLNRFFLCPKDSFGGKKEPLILPENLFTVSHGKHRSDNTCLNCGTTVQGRFCHTCGQENLEPKDTLLGLLSHFFNDLTHFDGKFFSSMKKLLLKPGFLTKEYMAGRRAGYLHPIRMYFFTSAVFFLIALSSGTKRNEFFKVDGKNRKEVLEERQRLLDKLSKTSDSSAVKKLKRQLDKNAENLVMIEQLGVGGKSSVLSDSTRQRIEKRVKAKEELEKKNPETRASYDSLQASLPEAQRDGWLGRYYNHKRIDINAKFRQSQQEFIQTVTEKFIHAIPKMMFVSLPLVALIFMLLYIRRRKEFFYVNHLIHVVHVFIAIYLYTLVTYFFGWLGDITDWSVFGWLNFFVVLYMLYYVYKSMRNFYGQSRMKTMLKFSVMLILVTIMFTLLSVVFVVNSLLAA